MTITERPTLDTTALVSLDMYKDIHKGIRAQLFDVTLEAGRLDASDEAARAALAAHVDGVVQLLIGHASHEDTFVQPVLEEYQPALAFEIARDHGSIHERLMTIRDATWAAARADGGEARALLHHLHLDLSLFTATYLRHEDVEERTVMPALLAHLGPDGVRNVDQALVASIPPDEKAAGLAVMLPAMNVDDRYELLDGVRAGGPPEVFAGVWALVQAVLAPRDVSSLAARLGL